MHKCLSTEDALRRVHPPPAVPERPPPQPRGYAQTPKRGKSSPRRKHSPPRAPSHKQALQLPQLLQEIDYASPSDRHTKVLLHLFAHHELAMQATMASASAPKPMVSRPTRKKLQRKDRLMMEREDMAMRRKLLLRPQSLTVS